VHAVARSGSFSRWHCAARRAREWTQALSRWCAEQPELVAFTSKCLVHRAEVLQLRGDWGEAMEEVSHACETDAEGDESKPPASAFYRQGEIHRLRGEFAAAEAAYRRANRRGREPQPGLALLRAAQGDTEAGLAALRRLLAAASDPLRRARLLPALTELALSVGELAQARAAAEELKTIAAEFRTDVLVGKAAQAIGAVELAEGNPGSASTALRESLATWRDCGAPYEAARVRVLIGLACRELGDEESAELEFDSARATFEDLGARTDLARLDALRSGSRRPESELLTPRQLQVLRRVADGKTNREIAGDLRVSERTIDRHVSNILTRLGVSSRAAATAYAFRNNML
jgi:DNA-binding CsgD family transcriptional regulator